MQDQWAQDGIKRNAFEVAKDDILIKTITKGLSKSKSNDRLVVIPLSQVPDPEFKPQVFENLSTPEKLKEADQYIAELQPSMVHVSMLEAVKRRRRRWSNTPRARSRCTS